jgi:hypothetical protein
MSSNFLHLVAILYGPGPCAVRTHFDKWFPPNLLNQQLKDVNFKAKLDKLKKEKVINGDNWKSLFPIQGM